MSGGEAGAIEGTLSVMVGGNAKDVERCRGVLEVMGSTVVHVGPNGAGQIVKAANQLIVAGTLELVAEAIVFLEAYKVDTAAAVKVLSGGLAGSTVLQRKAPSMLERSFKPGFRLELHREDLGIVLAAAREVGVVIPLGSAVSQAVAALVAQGYGGLDHSALLKLVEQLSGRRAAVPEEAVVALGAQRTAINSGLWHGFTELVSRLNSKLVILKGPNNCNTPGPGWNLNWSPFGEYWFETSADYDRALRTPEWRGAMAGEVGSEGSKVGWAAIVNERSEVGCNGMPSTPNYENMRSSLWGPKIAVPHHSVPGHAGDAVALAPGARRSVLDPEGCNLSIR